MFAPPIAPWMTPAHEIIPCGMAFISPPYFATKGSLQSPRISGGDLDPQKKHCAILPLSSPAQAWMSKSPPEILGDCKLPFVAKSGGEMKAIPQGIISCAGVIQGAMGGANIDNVDGVKKKIATYYSKMKMTPPWAKGNAMDIWSKDYAESYQQTSQQDWVSDLWNLWYPLRNEIITAFPFAQGGVIFILL